MTCFEASTWPCGLVALLGLAACQMDNPAFGDDGRVDEVGDANSEESGSSGESGESGSSSGADTTGTTDATDVADTLDANDQSETESSDGTVEVDLPNEGVCMADFTEPFSPIYGAPGMFDGEQCPPNVPSQYLKVTGAGPSPGLVMGQRCSAEGCLLCDGESLPVGVAGLDDFSSPLLQLVENQITACIKIQTGAFVDLDVEDRCMYESLWVGNIASSLLLASHRVSQPPPAGVAMLGINAPPGAGQLHVNCSCASVYDPGAEDLGCCDAVMGQPLVSSLLFLGADVWPGASATVSLSMAFDYTFHVAQAQNLPSCSNDGNAGLDMSWALVRQGL